MKTRRYLSHLGVRSKLARRRWTRHALFVAGGVCVGLGNGFLDVLRSAVDQVLGFLQAEGGDFANSLDGRDLVRAGILEDDGELGLLFHRCCRSCAAAGCWGRCCCCCRDAETLFELLDQS